MGSQIHSANDGSTREQLAVFVHGFGSSAICWAPFLDLFGRDPRIAGAFDFVCFEYPTNWFSFNPLRRMPRLLEIGRSLAAFLQEERFVGYREVTLVGHSQGGLVIQSYLADMLQDGKGEKLENIRQVILIATPNLGSTLLSPLRRFASHFSFFNPQERSLRVLDPQISDVRSRVSAKILNATTKKPTSWPIPIQSFWGLEDAVVPEASARGPFYNAAPLPGDHFSVIIPTDNNDDRYRVLSDALLLPAGHRRIFELDSYEVDIMVEPLPENYKYEATYGRNPIKKRKVLSNNRAHVNRAVMFSRKNSCEDLFEIRYRTRNDGYIKATMNCENEAPGHEQSKYDDYGTDVVLKFTPKRGQKHKLNLEIYKGFDEGNRDVHFHLGRKTYYKKYRLKLDLTAYVSSGYRITKLPKLYFHGHDMEDHKLCGQRTLDNPLDCVRSEGARIWEWELSNIREGVIDVAWDVAKH